MTCVVTAYRFGDKEKHSYVVGVYTSAKKACHAAKAEEHHRGGKYECEILSVDLDADNKYEHRFIKKLPQDKFFK